MQNYMAIFGLESYQWDYNDLAQVIGEGKALERVALYFRKPFSENPLIRESRLLRTFTERKGRDAKSLVESTNALFVQPIPPELTDEEYYDPTDKGMPWIMPSSKAKAYKIKRKVARRASRNV